MREVACRREPMSSARARPSSARSARCRRCIRRSSTKASRSMPMRAPASMSSGRRAASPSMRSISSRALAIAGASTSAAARAPTSARWPRISARRSAAAPIWRRCAVPRSGPLHVEAALPIEVLAEFDEAALDAALLPAHALVADWPEASLDGRRRRAISRRHAPPPDRRRRTRGCACTARAGAFLGTGHIAGGELIATRLLSPIEVEGCEPEGRLANRRTRKPALMTRQIRNIAIIAHVDHGKTTLVDQLLRQSGTFRAHEKVAERVMDSNDLEKRARHHDPGQELRRRVEGHAHQHRRHARPRRLRRRGRARAVDGRQRAAAGRCRRRADAADALRHQEGARAGPEADRRRQQGRPARARARTTSSTRPSTCSTSSARPRTQLDFPVDLRLRPQRLGDARPTGADRHRPGAAVRRHPAARAGARRARPTTRCSCRSARSTTRPTSAGSASAASTAARMKPMQDVAVYSTARTSTPIKAPRQPGAEVRRPRARSRSTEAGAGDIVLINGIEGIGIGVTLTDLDDARCRCRCCSVDEPTLTMNFCVNNSPLAGREGKFVTSRQIRDRLDRELQVQRRAARARHRRRDGIFEVSGRGELHLTILLENMRREGYELAVSKPRVVFHEKSTASATSRIEIVTVDVEDQHQGAVMEALGERRGDLRQHGAGRQGPRAPRLPHSGARPDRLPERVPEPDPRHRPDQPHLRRATSPYKGEIEGRKNGVLISQDDGEAVTYSLGKLDDRGRMFVKAGRSALRRHDHRHPQPRQRPRRQRRCAASSSPTFASPARKTRSRSRRRSS